MAITFQKEKLADCFDESRELQQQHFQEIAQNKDVLGGVNPDREMYMKLDALGLIHVLTARDDGKLVGYFVAFVRKHMHYQHIMCGSDDLFYLAPSHRRGMTGLRFIDAAIGMMRAAGAQHISIRDKFLSRDIGPLLERRGFKAIEIVYSARFHAASDGGG